MGVTVSGGTLFGKPEVAEGNFYLFLSISDYAPLFHSFDTSAVPFLFLSLYCPPLPPSTHPSRCHGEMAQSPVPYHCFPVGHSAVDVCFQ